VIRWRRRGGTGMCDSSMDVVKKTIRQGRCITGMGLFGAAISALPYRQ